MPRSREAFLDVALEIWYHCVWIIFGLCYWQGEENTETLIRLVIKASDQEKEENPLIMNTRYATHNQALIDAVLSSSGETDPRLRRAVEVQSAQLSGRPSQQAVHVPPELVAYIKKVALHAYRTTDEDIEALRAGGYSEDAIFELTLSAALGAGMARLERGLSVLKGGQDATSQD